MTTNTAKRLSQTALTNTTTTLLYTVPAATSTILKEIVLCNTDTVVRTVTIQAGPTPATSVATRLINAVSIQPNETQIYSFSNTLLTTDLVTGGASAGSVVSCSISGWEIA